VDVEDVRTIGRRVRQIRYARGKSLRVVAELAGVSKWHLDRIERGEVALDRVSEILALGEALEIAPSELIRLPVPAPASVALLKVSASRRRRVRLSQPRVRDVLPFFASSADVLILPRCDTSI
jgi:transcriptional regulator with XRE-family HTH domain